MTVKPKMKPAIRGAKTTATTLQDVSDAIEGLEALSVTQRRDQRSAVRRTAALLGDVPSRIPLDLPAISAQLATVSPVAAGLTSQELQQHPVRLPYRREGQRIEAGPTPGQDAAELGVGRAVRTPFREADAYRPVAFGSLCQRQRNRARARSTTRRSKPSSSRSAMARSTAGRTPPPEGGFDLERGRRKGPSSVCRQVIVPSFRRPPKRIEWTQSLPTRSARTSTNTSLGAADPICSPPTPVPVRWRRRPLQLRRNQIHAAVTALVESGVKPTAITSLADLVSPENFKRILRRRTEMVGGREKRIQSATSPRALVQIGRPMGKG